MGSQQPFQQGNLAFWQEARELAILSRSLEGWARGADSESLAHAGAAPAVRLAEGFLAQDGAGFLASLRLAKRDALTFLYLLDMKSGELNPDEEALAVAAESLIRGLAMVIRNLHA
ncbi:hypothetical protein HNR46_001029 [Haloferula luteola]|uniref:Four helix bundle protein n=1 Tax=Haloferula luteola TaxID=595692 RepID=A0A840UYI1_9BACT|nr:hypothetical protein [Haloferula luteola]MBB5350795.1 hypothetical protein [Haloferula luteola]